jgi:nucleoid-associated protein YgaU
MANRESTGLDLVVDRVQSKFPNFLLGATIVILAALFASLFFQGKNKGAAQQAAAVTPTQSVQAVNPNGEPFTMLSPTGEAQPTEAPTPTPVQKNLADTIAQVFQPKGEATPTPVVVREQSKLPGAGKTYIVQPGDYLSAISQKVYGSMDHVGDLTKSNNIENADRIEVGQKLYIPMVSQVTANAVPAPTGTVATSPSEQAATTQKVTLTGSSYTIQPGDCLWSIAQAAYGDGFMWSKIAAANNITTPNLIFAGNRLTLPSKQ